MGRLRSWDGEKGDIDHVSHCWGEKMLERRVALALLLESPPNRSAHIHFGSSGKPLSGCSFSNRYSPRGDGEGDEAIITERMEGNGVQGFGIAV